MLVFYCIALQMNQISINDFIDLMTSDAGPPCLLWLPILQRLAAVENGNILIALYEQWITSVNPKLLSSIDITRLICRRPNWPYLIWTQVCNGCSQSDKTVQPTLFWLVAATVNWEASQSLTALNLDEMSDANVILMFVNHSFCGFCE